MSNLKKKFKQDLISELVSVLELKNLNEAPKLVKITLNMGLGEAVGDKKIIQKALKDLELITGQKPVVTKAKKSVAGFKIRAGWPIGVKVTLRSDKMYDFLERLICIALPRVVDFRGLSLKSFDGKGNYSMGVKEQIIFPEINYDEIDCLRGMDITFTTTAKTDAHGEALLKAFKFPFRKK